MKKLLALTVSALALVASAVVGFGGPIPIWQMNVDPIISPIINSNCVAVGGTNYSAPVIMCPDGTASFAGSISAGAFIGAGGSGIPYSEKGAANGVATLDASAKLTYSEIPDSLLGGVSFQGTYDVPGDSPTLPACVSTTLGYYYIASVAGTLGQANFEYYDVADWVICDATGWSKVDNVDSVTSVNGRIGDVVGLEEVSARQQTMTASTVNYPSSNAVISFTNSSISTHDDPQYHFDELAELINVTLPSCANGMALIMSTDNYSWTCAYIAGAGDNLGSHVAAQNLNMSGFEIQNATEVELSRDGAPALHFIVTTAGGDNWQVTANASDQFSITQWVGDATPTIRLFMDNNNLEWRRSDTGTAELIVNTTTGTFVREIGVLPSVASTLPVGDPLDMQGNQLIDSPNIVPICATDNYHARFDTGTSRWECVSAAGGQDWSTFPAIQNVDIDGFDITNIGDTTTPFLDVLLTSFNSGRRGDTAVGFYQERPAYAPSYFTAGAVDRSIAFVNKGYRGDSSVYTYSGIELTPDSYVSLYAHADTVDIYPSLPRYEARLELDADGTGADIDVFLRWDEAGGGWLHRLDMNENQYRLSADYDVPLELVILNDVEGGYIDFQTPYVVNTSVLGDPVVGAINFKDDIVLDDGYHIEVWDTTNSVYIGPRPTGFVYAPDMPGIWRTGGSGHDIAFGVQNSGAGTQEFFIHIDNGREVRIAAEEIAGYASEIRVIEDEIYMETYGPNSDQSDFDMYGGYVGITAHGGTAYDAQFNINSSSSSGTVDNINLNSDYIFNNGSQGEVAGALNFRDEIWLDSGYKYGIWGNDASDQYFEISAYEMVAYDDSAQLNHYVSIDFDSLSANPNVQMRVYDDVTGENAQLKVYQDYMYWGDQDGTNLPFYFGPDNIDEPYISAQGDTLGWSNVTGGWQPFGSGTGAGWVGTAGSDLNMLTYDIYSAFNSTHDSYIMLDGPQKYWGSDGAGLYYGGSAASGNSLMAGLEWGSDDGTAGFLEMFASSDGTVLGIGAYMGIDASTPEMYMSLDGAGFIAINASTPRILMVTTDSSAYLDLEVNYLANTNASAGTPVQGAINFLDDTAIGAGYVSYYYGSTGYTNVPAFRLNPTTYEMEYRDEDEAGWTTLDSLAAGATAHSLGSSTHPDVVITSPANGEVLLYEISSGNWINSTVSGSGDNLGDHNATEDLDLNGWDIIDIGALYAVGTSNLYLNDTIEPLGATIDLGVAGTPFQDGFITTLEATTIYSPANTTAEISAYDSGHYGFIRDNGDGTQAWVGVDDYPLTGGYITPSGGSPTTSYLAYNSAYRNGPNVYFADMYAQAGTSAPEWNNYGEVWIQATGTGTNITMYAYDSDGDQSQIVMADSALDLDVAYIFNSSTIATGDPIDGAINFQDDVAVDTGYVLYADSIGQQVTTIGPLDITASVATIGTIISDLIDGYNVSDHIESASIHFSDSSILHDNRSDYVGTEHIDWNASTTILDVDAVVDRDWDTVTWDAEFGDSVDEGQIRVGNGYIGQANDTVGALGTAGIFYIRNDTDVSSNIAFMFEGSSSNPRFVIPEEGADYATYNPRSLTVGPSATYANVAANVLCSANFQNIDCDTGVTGADLGVQDDVEVNGSIFVDVISEDTAATGVTIDGLLIQDGDATAITHDSRSDYVGTEHLDWTVNTGQTIDANNYVDNNSYIGTATSDLNMGSTYQVVNLQAPAALGEAIRQTANVTETNLNTLTGGGDTTLHDHDGISENTTHRTSTGADHTYIDQSVVNGATPTFTGTNFSGIPNTALTNGVRDVAFRFSMENPVDADDGLTLGLASGACTMQDIKCRTTTSAVTIRLYNNGAGSPLTAADISCGVGGVGSSNWTDGGTLQNTSVADGSEIYFNITSAGTATYLAIDATCRE